MENEKLITADNIDAVWSQVTEDLTDNEFAYSVIISFQNKKIYLDIDVDPGGGFEGGYQTTTLKSRLEKAGDFKFALHHQGLLDEIGKFFGMEDIQTGYVEFDKKVIVKTNDTARIKSVFSEKESREPFEDLANFTFHITQHHIDETDNKADYLELNIEEAITDIPRLRQVYTAFSNVLDAIENSQN
ncbi:MAG: hypothetical protein ABJA90_07915 [Ginsengibacter sp.]